MVDVGDFLLKIPLLTTNDGSPGFFFERLKKTELPKKLSHQKTEAFWKKKLSVPEEFQGHQAEKTQFALF